MRSKCWLCTYKHIAQAIILSEEMRVGYPEHLVFVIGHLAEAETESPDANLSLQIRNIRLSIMEKYLFAETFDETDFDFLWVIKHILDNIKEK